MNLIYIPLGLGVAALLISLALLVLHTLTRTPHDGAPGEVTLADDPDWMSDEARLIPSLHDRGPIDGIIAARTARAAERTGPTFRRRGHLE